MTASVLVPSTKTQLVGTAQPPCARCKSTAFGRTPTRCRASTLHPDVLEVAHCSGHSPNKQPERR